MKKYKVIFIILVTIILGFVTGIYLYKINKIYTKKEIERIAKVVEDNKKVEGIDLSVSSIEEKTSPNCTIVLKVYYDICGHLIETRKNIGKTEVNMKETEIKEKFKEWELQKFTRKGDCFI